MQRKDNELKGSSNGVIGGDHKWLKARTQEITWLSKLKISSGKEAQVGMGPNPVLKGFMGKQQRTQASKGQKE